MELKKNVLAVLLLIIIFYVSGQSNSSNSIINNDKKVKNIILLIGDGMGITQLYAGYTHNKGQLNVLRCNYIGIQTTYSNNKYITDSGASGTALSSGKKTNNKMVGVGPDSLKYQSILEIAEKNNLATGLVVTSSITDATPAAFYAHQPFRDNFENIASDLIASGIDVFVGGGRKYFTNRSDNKNLVDTLMNCGYQVKYTLEDIKTVKSGKLAGLTSESNSPRHIDGRGDFLSEVAKTAIDILCQDKDGFFLMVEGSQIDWGGHNNDADYVISEVVDFDKAVKVALDFAEKNKETLVIVTADHETGGLSIVNGDLNSGKTEIDFSTSDHTGVWVPVYSFGPKAETFSGFYDNTDIFHKMLKAFGF